MLIFYDLQLGSLRFCLTAYITLGSRHGRYVILNSSCFLSVRFLPDYIYITFSCYYSTELGLQRIETQTGVALSRTIATPNIASKGKLLPRAITVPSSLIQKRETKPPPSDTETAFANIAPNASKSDAASKSQHVPLIQEIESTPVVSPTAPVPRSTKVPKSADTSLPGLRGILKKPVASPKGAAELDTSPEANVDPLVPLEWDWSKDDKGRLRIVIKISGLVSHSSIIYSFSLL